MILQASGGNRGGAREDRRVRRTAVPVEDIEHYRFMRAFRIRSIRLRRGDDGRGTVAGVAHLRKIGLDISTWAALFVPGLT